MNHKKTMYVLCFASLSLSVCFPITAQSESLEGLFNKGVTELRKRNCGLAAQYFGQIQNLHISDPDVFYNKGLSFQCLGQYGKAILYFERAKELAPHNSETKEKLRAVYQKLSERHASDAPNREFSYHPPLSRILTGWISLSHASMTVLFLNLLTFIALAYVVWGRNENARIAAGLGSFLLGLATVALVLVCLSKSHVILGKPTAVVLHDHTTLGTTPARTTKSAEEAFEGEQAQVQDQQGGYVFLSFSGNRKGWVPSKAVGFY